MATGTAQTNPPDLKDHTNFDTGAHARTYGIILGVLTAIYLIVLNFIYPDDIPMGLRFAKHLIIIPVVWYAAGNYASKLPDNKVFKAEITYLMSLAAYTAVTLVAINVLVYIITGTSFEQFMQDGDAFAGMMINCGFVFFETVVFVMVVSFIVLQGYKGGGSPED
ncbi:hypothetical protein [Neolewinella antarctica]|uniref:Uncharacterized protein n=1 Tax=Neolewinella antarctica TaxID=442734 RepID=A0ABX0X6S7_9BACT|nr:hypothetical protein [Neolewinella antarctica]NJC24694.1 hypothetical protein [Neolewinella antarctica]